MKDKSLTPVLDITISEEEMPEAISGAIKNITELDSLIIDAEDKCKLAKEAAERQSSVKSTKTKEAIISTQDAVRSLADSQAVIVDTQKMLFEYQQKLTDSLRYLLILGTSSIAMNRLVISELESKLKSASQEELSKKAREELIGVVRLLREQESAFSKQDRMSEQINENKKAVKIHDDEIMRIHQIDEEQNATDIKHDKQIAAGKKKDAEQDVEIKRQRDIDKQHDIELGKIKNIAVSGTFIAIVALILAILGFIK